MIARIEGRACLTAANALFALGKEALLDGCTVRSPLLGDRVARPDKRLNAAWAGGSSQTHPEPLIRLVAAPLCHFKCERVRSSRYSGSLPKRAAISDESHWLPSGAGGLFRVISLPLAAIPLNPE